MRPRPLIRAALGLSLIALTARAVSRRRRARLVFVGGQGEGVHAARLDEATGRLTALGLAAELARPTWLLADPRDPYLYAVSELGNDGGQTGEVASFRINRAGGRLEALGRTGSGGSGPTHLAFDPGSRTLFVANFGDGRTSTIPVTSGGALGAVSSVQFSAGSGPHRRQQGPHPHGVTLDPTRRFLLVPDMGADKVFIHRFDPVAGTIAPASKGLELPAGSGPRLLIFGRDGRFAYLLTELSAEVFVLRWRPETGDLERLAATTLDPSIPEGSRSAAALAINAKGDRLYASDRAAKTIVVYAVNPASGLLDKVQAVPCGGARPWSVELSPSGRWLLVTNQESNDIRVFEVDRATGALTATSHALSIPAPTSVAFPRPRRVTSFPVGWRS